MLQVRLTRPPEYLGLLGEEIRTVGTCGGGTVGREGKREGEKEREKEREREGERKQNNEHVIYEQKMLQFVGKYVQ